MMEVDEDAQDILLQVSQLDHISRLDRKAHPRLLHLIQEYNMVDYYHRLNEQTSGMVQLDKNLVNEMMMRNEKKMSEFESMIKDAEENLGETEVRDAIYKRAIFYSRTQGREVALKEFEVAMEKTVGSGQKIDVLFDLLRYGFFLDDLVFVKGQIEKCKDLVEKGGDWERRNKLKVYEALYLLTVRDFKAAANLLLDSVATFTCTELFDFEHLVWYCVTTAVVAVDRKTLREKVIDSPDIRQVIGSVPYLESLVHSLYSSNYDGFFRSVVGVMTEGFKRDRYLSRHENYYLREIRVVAYKQFLQSYVSVTLDSMSQAFGVSIGDLSQFIAANRLNCKIDKVNGVVEMNILDSKNSQYQTVIRQGDLLLNRIQKLARVLT